MDRGRSVGRSFHLFLTTLFSCFVTSPTFSYHGPLVRGVATEGGYAPAVEYLPPCRHVATPSYLGSSGTLLSKIRAW